MASKQESETYKMDTSSLSQKQQDKRDKDEKSSSSEDEDHLDISNDEDFAAITPGDSNVEIIGIVRNLEQEASVGKTEKKKKLLRKFTLTNLEKKRIRCCIWEKEKIDALEEIVREGYKIHILKAQAKSPDMRFFPQNERNLLPIELHIGKHTEIQTFGKVSASREKPIVYHSADFNSILSFDGAVSIQGFLKQDFAITTASRQTFIINAITDGEHKINVVVKNTAGATDFDKYQKGERVEVKGLIDVDGETGMVEIICNDICQISKVLGAEKLSKKRCSAGSRPLKRIKTDSL